MVATDGRRMSICYSSAEIPDFVSVIIPVKMLSIIDKISPNEGNINLSITEKEFYFMGGGYELYCSLIEGQFPAYQKVIPSNLDKTIKIAKSDLTDSLKRNTILAEKSGKINLCADAGKMIISSPESEIGNSTEEIPAIYDDVKTEIFLNAQFLMDVLKVIDSDSIIFNFKVNQDNKVMSAVTVSGKEQCDDYLHIIMPMTN